MNRMNDPDSFGTLPKEAPLANPYVPYQRQEVKRYEPPKALIRGTLFPGLDLPLMGFVNRQEKPQTCLTNLQQTGFVLQELALYLDTHPGDRNALAQYRMYQTMYRKACEEYERRFGPLSHQSEQDGDYEWLREPWPWEYAGNREE